MSCYYTCLCLLYRYREVQCEFSELSRMRKSVWFVLETSRAGCPLLRVFQNDHEKEDGYEGSADFSEVAADTGRVEVPVALRLQT